MLGSNMLEIAIGVIFVFLLVSTICTAVREGIEARLKTRAAYLEQGIRQLLNDATGTGIAKSLYEHPLIYGLFNSDYKPGKTTGTPDLLAKGGNLPSYIPSKNFAKALMDILARGHETGDVNATAGAPVLSLDEMRANIAQIQNPAVQRVLLNAIDTAQGDLNRAQANIENWFNSGMDRVSGWYKRSTQWIIFWVALIVTVSLNINTITITSYLSKNDTARKILVEQAAAAARDTTHTYNYCAISDTTHATGYCAAKAELDDLKLPIGWDHGLSSLEINPAKAAGFWNSFLGPLLGLLITALAATLGAPFWFDMLNKVMVIRSTVKPHEKSGEEASQDRSDPQPQVVYTQLAPAQRLGAADVQINTAYHEPDGCDVVATDLTADEDLPESKGGIA